MANRHRKDNLHGLAAVIDRLVESGHVKTVWSKDKITNVAFDAHGSQVIEGFDKERPIHLGRIAEVAAHAVYYGQFRNTINFDVLATMVSGGTRTLVQLLNKAPRVQFGQQNPEIEEAWTTKVGKGGDKSRKDPTMARDSKGHAITRR